MKKTILVITDGIGHSNEIKFNAFKNAKTPTYGWLFENTANCLIKTSGTAVGLPEGQMGNSEVGHMCIGSGRVLYQSLVQIDKAIEDESLAKNPDLKKFLSNYNNIHIIGLISDGGVHSHINHFIYMAKICANFGKKVFLHLITDGRDVSPTSGIDFVKTMQNLENENIKIATVSGRFYAMDRDKRWERIQESYDNMCNPKRNLKINPSEYLRQSYESDITDEFIKPASFGDFKGIQANDGLIFINFRNDRMKEIVTAFGDKNFQEFKRKFINSNILTMTNYDDKFTYKIIFKNEKPKNTLAEVIEKNGLSQLHTAETEKYAHVTFFFNGGKEDLLKNESRVLVSSPKIKTYDLKPQMSANEVTQVVLKGMDFGYDFIVVNFANGDMVGHTGNYEASVKAVETVDEALGQIVKKVQEKDYSLIITSDHGNCEAMKDENGNALTNHTTFDVYCFIMDEKVKKLKGGGLNNIAASVLKLMGLEAPSEMDEALF